MSELNAQGQPAVPAEEDFVTLYGNVEVTVEKRGYPLKFTIAALVKSEMYCPAPKESRQDPEMRIRYLAATVGVDNLLPEHRWLVETVEAPDA